MNYTQQANQWLRRFRVDITSNSPRVFANGRQQVRVTVTLEPRDGQAISQEALDSLQLILIDDDGNIRDLDAELAVSTERDSRFTYHADSGSAPSPLMEAATGTIRRHFYVTSTLPGGTLSTIYAGIWKDQENSFETNRAPFLSSVEIESITPRRLTEDHFELAVEDAGNNGATDIDLYYLKFKEPSRYIASSKSLAIPSGVAFYSGWKNTSPWYAIHSDLWSSYRYTHYAFDVGAEFEWTSSNGEVTVRLNKHQGCMTLLRERELINSNAASTETRDWSIWEVIDQHGNAIVLRFVREDQGNRIGFTTDINAPL